MRCSATHFVCEIALQLTRRADVGGVLDSAALGAKGTP
jgi:hypothetical protein